MAGVFTDHALLADLTRLMTLTCVPEADSDRILAAIAGTRQPSAVRTLLLASTRRRAWVAANDGYVHHWEDGVLLTVSPFRPDFRPRARRVTDDLGGSRCIRADRYRWSDPEAWRYTRLGGRTLRVADGAPVKVGDALTDGPVYLGDIQRVWGTKPAIANGTGRLSQATGLSAEDADQVVRLLFGAVKVVEAGADLPPGARLSTGAVVSHEVFMHDNQRASEQGKADGRNYMSAGRPLFMSVAVALAIADNGGVLPQ
ncbi:hypothetical protein ABIA31_000625 [Catenulispora sp. MAP5-51]